VKEPLNPGSMGMRLNFWRTPALPLSTCMRAPNSAPGAVHLSNPESDFLVVLQVWRWRYLVTDVLPRYRSSSLS
jgi:hypothetical protein